MSVFRIATKQAIRDIIEENAVTGRFGLTLTEDNLEAISDRVVDLFEMTLNLRQQLQHRSGAPEQQNQRQTQPQSQPAPQRRSTIAREPAPFPRTRNAAEIYETSPSYLKQQDAASDANLPPQLDLKLPRKRIGLSSDELERLKKS